MRVRALVVNNRETMRKAFLRTLILSKLADFSFAEAKSFSDALAKFDPQNTDMLFLEWDAPGTILSDFIRRLRTRQRQHVPIVMITTDAALVKMEQTPDDGGVDYYAVRPFTAATLNQKLAPFFQRLAAAPKKTAAQAWQYR